MGLRMNTSHLGETSNPTLKDFQRQKVYYAEASCGFWNNPTLLSASKVRDLIKDISLWATISPPKIFLPWQATLRNGKYVVHTTASELVLPFPLAKSVPFLCHEMAHVINYQRGPADHHGPNFATAYLEVMNQFVGNQEYEDLKEAFQKYKVEYKEVIHI